MPGVVETSIRNTQEKEKEVPSGICKFKFRLTLSPIIHTQTNTHPSRGSPFHSARAASADPLNYARSAQHVVFAVRLSVLYAHGSENRTCQLLTPLLSTANRIDKFAKHSRAYIYRYSRVTVCCVCIHCKALICFACAWIGSQTF